LVIDLLDLHSFPTRRSSDLCSSAWSTLITSSMRREMSLANRSLIVVAVIACPSENLRPVVMLGVQYSHEAQARRPIELARVKEKDRKSTRLNSSHVKISYAV